MPRDVVLLSSGGAAGYGVTNQQLLKTAGFRIAKPKVSPPAPQRQRERASRPRAASPRRQRSAQSSGDPPDDEPPPLPPRRRVTDKSAARRVCEVCGGKFASSRSDARICSNRCRQRAFRNRRTQERVAALAATLDSSVFFEAADGDPLLALDLAIREPEIRHAFGMAL
jgi:predicted nucleic acid-binding Zn ribbon protein